MANQMRNPHSCVNGFFEKKLLPGARGITCWAWSFTFFDEFQSEKLPAITENYMQLLLTR
jgi:hypothetical protein